MTGVLGLSLVGRERELGLIGDLLDHADEGGAAVVLEDVPGIGKSALLEEAKRAPRAVCLSTKRGFLTERAAARDTRSAWARVRRGTVVLSRMTFGELFPAWLRARILDPVKPTTV
jgi:hypothetical protein